MRIVAKVVIYYHTMFARFWAHSYHFLSQTSTASFSWSNFSLFTEFCPPGCDTSTRCFGILQHEKYFIIIRIVPCDVKPSFEQYLDILWLLVLQWYVLFITPKAIGGKAAQSLFFTVCFCRKKSCVQFVNCPVQLDNCITLQNAVLVFICWAF